MSKKIKLGDYCDIIKGDIGIQKAIPGEYPLVVTAEERLSHNEYQFDTAAVIIPLVSSTGHGHASLKRIHYQEGKFALGTILCAVIIKDTTIINPRYLYIYLSYFKDHLLVPLMKGAANVTLSIKKIKDVEIILPTLERQLEIIELEKNNDLVADLESEIQTQKKLLTQLKQSILQEAIQGKLTTDWRKQNPDVEPASELLKRIKAEKAQLIKDKKIKKEKPLPPITQEEIPFELPEGWVWCYINELAELYTGNSINKTEKEAKYTKQQEGLIYIGTKDVEFDMKGINYNTGVIIPTKELDKFKIAPKNTVLICIEGGSSGRKIGITTQDVCFGNKLLVANTYINELSKFIYFLYNSPHFKSEFDKQRKGLRGGVSVNSFKNIKIPLPPLTEQKAIVEKVEKLMQKVSAMEEEITKSEQNAQMLMQAVLKEAFEGKKEEVEV
jgi:type I restriction enzyme S subunit